VFLVFLAKKRKKLNPKKGIFWQKKWLATISVASLYVISPLPQGAQDRFLRRIRYAKSLP
jgi:hypothetical protein